MTPDDAVLDITTIIVNILDNAGITEGVDGMLDDIQGALAGDNAIGTQTAWLCLGMIELAYGRPELSIAEWDALKNSIYERMYPDA